MILQQITDDSVFDKQPDIVHRRIAGESLLVPIRGRLADMQRIYALSPVADFVWERIDGIATVGDITNAVLGRFDVDARQAGADTAEFISGLTDAGLVVRV